LQRQAQVERRRVGAHEHIKFIEEKNLQEHNQDLTEPKKKTLNNVHWEMGAVQKAIKHNQCLYMFRL